MIRRGSYRSAGALARSLDCPLANGSGFARNTDLHP